MSFDLGNSKTNDDLIKAVSDIQKLCKSLNTRTPESISRAATMVPTCRTKRFFDHFQNLLEKNDLLQVLDCPDAFYNINETNFVLNPSMKREFFRGIVRK